VSSSSIIDDVANLRHVPEVLALAGEGELPLERLRRIACGSATRADVEQFGDVWTKTLVDLLQVGSTAVSLTGPHDWQGSTLRWRCALRFGRRGPVTEPGWHECGSKTLAITSAFSPMTSGRLIRPD
jgi:hypothetical protein